MRARTEVSGLAWRVSAVIVATTVALAALTWVATDWLAARCAEARVRDVAVLVAHPLAAAVEADDGVRAGEALRGLEASPAAAYGVVRRADGTLLASWRPELAPAGVALTPSAGVPASEVRDGMAHAASVVSGRAGSVGAVQIGLSLAGEGGALLEVRRAVLLGDALVLALAIALAWAIARSALRPIAELASTAERVVHGEASPDALDGGGGDGEIAALAKTLRGLSSKLRDIPKRLEGSVGDLRVAVTGLTELTSVQTAALQRQASSLAQASATTQEIKQTSGLAASKAKTVFQIAEKAEEFSVAGQSAVEASIQSLKDIREQVGAIVGRIANLSDKTVQVGDIIESVKDLADQSNVLALNAAIEASRAGEFGKSFSVVAREMRSLADQSIQSTARIREILSEIQDAIRSTVAITEEGTQKMEHSMEQIRASGENLREMTAIIQESSQAAQQIAATVSQQNAGIEQISGSLVGLNAVMEETVRGIRKAEDAVVNLKATSVRLVEIVDESRR